ncbi:colicin immunity domain-containing protein [Pseudomonas xantholysinigenes]|uniref:Colicin D immunity protein domain-containing protein n=1 Tax=Pseudomonas xantholysinigenes TaxID=2745490 RepID=A0A9E6PTY0_9PSED|nr:hypothetical protein HU772_016980 [Pseudomonas xantholysinigenes]
MSLALIDLAKKFLSSSISSEEFSKTFFETWRSEGESGLLAQDEPKLGSCLTLMFGLVDSLVEDTKDFSSELTEPELRIELTRLLRTYEYL